ncbi:hypothetical protein [Demequina iriomotensis]|uniref:hypothetical protein n=1 Tax=Demequina iriomotensis TaxID=1536641 RepID=UPI0007847706|nr:hypothetical protein [Demequina iriomotensis]
MKQSKRAERIRAHAEEQGLTEPHARADRLKERIYLTFSGLAVVLALSTHGHVEPSEALTTLAVTALGTLLAVFTADLISHLLAHERLVDTTELRHAVRSSFGALSSLLLPFIFLGVSAAGAWDITNALVASAIALIVALVMIGYLAARQVQLGWWQRIVVLGAEAALGLAVVGLELLAHA